MTDNGPDDIVLRHLRDFGRKLDTTIERLDNLAARVTSMEAVLGLLVTQVATLNARLDMYERRIRRIERRLDLVEEPDL